MSSRRSDAANPPGFACSQCGDCCRNFDESRGVVLFPWDERRLADHLGLSPSAFASRFVRKTGLAVGPFDLPLLEIAEGRCVFLGADNRCGVHESKPTQCERGPFGFFWRGTREYSCMESTVVPAQWSTLAKDKELIRRRFADGGIMHGKNLSELAKEMDALAADKARDTAPNDEPRSDERDDRDAG